MRRTESGAKLLTCSKIHCTQTQPSVVILLLFLFTQKDHSSRRARYCDTRFNSSPPFYGVTMADNPARSLTDDAIVERYQANPPPQEVLDLDHVYEALGHPRRRYLCYTLCVETEWTLDDLAVKIAAWEWDIPEQDVSEAIRDSVYVSLHHAHVPKLVDEGVITFDQSTETIRAAGNAVQVLSALEGVGGSIDSRQETHARSEMDDGEQ